MTGTFIAFLGPAFVAISVVAYIARNRCRVLQWQLEDTTLQFQMVLDNMVEGIAVIDPDRTIVFTNGSDLNLVSMQGPQHSYAVIEQQYEASTPEGERLPFDQWPSSRALNGDFVRSYCVHYRNLVTGETRARVVTTAPVPGPRGRAGQVIMSYRDDTERARTDDARARLAAIVESSDDAIISKDVHGIVTSWNGGAKKIFGYTAVEMIGKSITILLPPERLYEEEQILQSILSGKHIVQFQTERLTRENQRIQVSVTISPIFNSTGDIVGASKVARDITSTRNLERQLQQAQKMEAIGQLTGGIAHDFNNLLGIISGNLDLLEDLVSARSPALQRVVTARKAASRAADLTRRLLAFSSKEVLNPVATQLHQSVRNTLELATRVLGPEIEISTNLAPSLPHVLIDPSGLESALLNLLLNARDAMPIGGKLHITTSSFTVDATHPHAMKHGLALGDYALITVADSGHGMTKETLDRIFEPFFTTKERGRGTGLGLPMVYGFARQSRGHVHVYSEAGYGTTVSLYLPFTDASAPQTFATPANTGHSTHTESSILLVDDEVDLLDIASTYLNKLGYNTLIAKNATHALRLVSEHPGIDLIVTDIVMSGGMNGIDLARAVSQQHPEIKSIYTSGFPSDALAEKNFTVAGHILLNKPYRLSELAEAVSTTLAEHPTLNQITRPPMPQTLHV